PSQTLMALGMGGWQGRWHIGATRARSLCLSTRLSHDSTHHSPTTRYLNRTAIYDPSPRNLPRKQGLVKSAGWDAPTHDTDRRSLLDADRLAPPRSRHDIGVGLARPSQ